MSRLETLSEHTTKWLLGRPRQVAAVLSAIVIASVISLGWLRIESGMSAFVSEEDPAQVLHREIERAFISDDLLYVAYETKDPFSQASLQEIRALGDQLAQLSVSDDAGLRSLVDDVTSLATIKDVSGADMSYRTVPLVPEVIPSDPAELSAIRERAQRNQLIRDGLLSKSSPRVAALLARLVPDVSDDDKAYAVRELRRMLAERSQASDTVFYATGAPVIEFDTAHYMQKDLGTFIPLSYGLVLLLMLIFTHRAGGVLLAVVNATVAILVGMGILAHVGTVTNLSTIMPPLLMVLSVATIVHFLSEYAWLTQQGVDGAAQRSIRELLIPSFMTELTTAVGFVSFVFSIIPALRQFGVAASLSVMGVFVTSFLVLALAVRWVGPERLISRRSQTSVPFVQRLLAHATDLSLRRPKVTLLAVGLVTACFGAGFAHLRVDHDTMAQFDSKLPIRIANEFVDSHLGGSGDYVVSIRVPEENRFLEPSELKKLEAFQDFLVSKVGATQTTSIVDYVKLMHRGFNDDAPEAFRIPDTRQQVAQLVVLNGDDRFFQVVDRTYRWVRVSARTTERSSARLADRFAEIERYLAEHFPASEGYDARPTGNSHLGVVMIGNILSSQTTSFILSFILIFVPISIVFRSVVAGAFTVPSNIFPVVACLGLMGWLDIPLDVATTMITSIILGIAVDDTIHFVQSTRRMLSEGLTMEHALRDTMATKGVGAMWITLIITVGFLVMIISNFHPTSNFGILTAFAMVAGVMAEIFLLPPLLILTKTRLGVPPKAPSS